MIENNIPGDVPASQQANPPGWERSVLERLAFDSLAEQRRRRRWGIFFKLVNCVWVALVLLIVWKWQHGDAEKGVGVGPHTALVQLEGEIGPGGEASAEKVIAGLTAAFDDKDTKGVVLLINSPGGSPVQSGIINDEMVPSARQASDDSAGTSWSKTCAHRAAITLPLRLTRFSSTRPASSAPSAFAWTASALPS